MHTYIHTYIHTYKIMCNAFVPTLVQCIIVGCEKIFLAFIVYLLKISYAHLLSPKPAPCFAHLIKSRRRGWWGYVSRMAHRRGPYRIFVGRPEGKRRCVRPRRRWEDNIKIYSQVVGWVAWTASIWLMIRTNGRLFWMRQRIPGLHKMRRISWLPKDRLASQEGLCSIELLIINPLNTKHRLLYLRAQVAPRSKHFSCRL